MIVDQIQIDTGIKANVIYGWNRMAKMNSIISLKWQKNK